MAREPKSKKSVQTSLTCQNPIENPYVSSFHPLIPPPPSSLCAFRWYPTGGVAEALYGHCACGQSRGTRPLGGAGRWRARGVWGVRPGCSAG